VKHKNKAKILKIKLDKMLKKWVQKINKELLIFILLFQDNKALQNKWSFLFEKREFNFNKLN
jgi:hypothetical protein